MSTPPKDIRHPNRFITTHDENGKAVFDDSIPEAVPLYQTPGSGGVDFALCYATTKIPAPISPSPPNDISTYNNLLTNLPGIMIPGGTVLRMVDMPPGSLSPMHRTVSLDYGVVLEGEVELILDGGVKRVMKRGDVSVQRGTMHAWRNVSKDGGWSRMLYVLNESEDVVVGGGKLGEDYGGMEGTKPSGK